MALTLDESKENDLQAAFGELNVVIDKDLSKTLGKVKVDFISDATGQGFMVESENPIPTPEGSGCSSCTSCG